MRDSWARFGNLSSLYAQAAEVGYDDYLGKSEELSRLAFADDPVRFSSLETQISIAGVKSIVFSAMCLEATINDFSGIHLGDGYTEDHIEKLDLLSKWSIVLRLASGYEFDRSREPYSLLKSLVSARNRLVHNKSKESDLGSNAKTAALLQKRDEQFGKDVHGSFKALVIMSLEMDLALGNRHNPLALFGQHLYRAVEMPDRLKILVSKYEMKYRESAANNSLQARRP